MRCVYSVVDVIRRVPHSLLFCFHFVVQTCRLCLVSRYYSYVPCLCAKRQSLPCNNAGIMISRMWTVVTLTVLQGWGVIFRDNSVENSEMCLFEWFSYTFILSVPRWNRIVDHGYMVAVYFRNLWRSPPFNCFFLLSRLLVSSSELILLSLYLSLYHGTSIIYVCSEWFLWLKVSTLSFLKPHLLFSNGRWPPRNGNKW